jgi:hypothetical protein
MDNGRLSARGAAARWPAFAVSEDAYFSSDEIGIRASWRFGVEMLKATAAVDVTIESRSRSLSRRRNRSPFHPIGVLDCPVGSG